MDSSEDLLKLIAQKDEETINVKEFIFKLLNYWYWFVIFGIVGGGSAYFYNKYVPSSYSVSSLVLIKEKEANGISMDNLFDNFQLKSNVKIENHIGVLTSFSLNRRVVENLGWNVFWYQDMPFGDYSLYGNEPYEIIVDDDVSNLQGVPLYVSPIDGNRYLIIVDSDVIIEGEEYSLVFEQEGEYGTKFKNKYFNFVLNKNRDIDDNTYCFRFNNLNSLAVQYQKKIEVAAVNKNADLISLKLEGQSPFKEISYLNELTKVYTQFGLHEKNMATENTIHFIDRQLSDIVDTLRVTGDNFSDYRASNKVFDLGQKASLVVEKLVQLDSKKSLAQMQLNYYENLSSYLDNADKIKKMIAPSVVGITDVTLNSLMLKLIDLYGKKEALSFSLQDKNPSILMVDNELEYTKRSLNENLKNLVFNTKQELKAMQSEIDEVNDQLGDYPKTEQDLINIKRMFDLNNELYTFLLQKRAEAEITKASNIPDIKVLDPASEATFFKIGPKKTLNLFIGFFVGLAIPFLFIISMDYFDETIHTKEDIQKLTSIPILGSIVHNSNKERISVIEQSRSVFAESLRELRTNLYYLYRDEDSIVIGIQSVVSGEGKSFIALNLAEIMAMNNKRIILIGADMRKPTLHNILGGGAKEGLSTYLIGRHGLDEVIKSTGVKNLDFISSGIIPPNPAELLGTVEFDILIEELKRRYDVIIIDNSPAMLVTDGAIVKRHTNIDLFVTRQNYSHKKLIEVIDQIGEKNKFKRIGIVFNDIKSKRFNQYSYQYNGYYKRAYGAGGDYFDEGKKRKNGLGGAGDTNVGFQKQNVNL